MIGSAPGLTVPAENVSMQLSFADGSFGTIHYLANGGKAFPKERRGLLRRGCCSWITTACSAALAGLASSR